MKPESLSHEDKRTEVDNILAALTEHVLPINDERKIGKKGSERPKFEIKIILDQAKNLIYSILNAWKKDSQLLKICLLTPIPLAILWGEEIFPFLLKNNNQIATHLSNQLGFPFSKVAVLIGQLEVLIYLSLVLLSVFPWMLYSFWKVKERQKLIEREILRHKMKSSGKESEEFTTRLSSDYKQRDLKITEERIQTLIFEMEKEEKKFFEISPIVVLSTIAIIIYSGLIPESLSTFILSILGIVSLAWSKEALSSLLKFLTVSKTQNAIFIYKKSLALLREAQLRQKSMDDLPQGVTTGSQVRLDNR